MEKRDPENCPTCNGYVLINGVFVRSRVTKGGVCETCGKDYFDQLREVQAIVDEANGRD